MSNPTDEFFDGLHHRGHEPLLQEAVGTIRFDLGTDAGTDRWFVAVRKGDLRVSRDGPEPDCVVRTRRAHFDRFAVGEADIFAAWTRNQVTVEGDLRLASLFRQVLPGPPGAHHPRAFARERRPQP
jgi:putative sterol carrier protein